MRALFCFAKNAARRSIMVCIVRVSSPGVTTAIGFVSTAPSTKATSTKATKRGCLREKLLPRVREFCGGLREVYSHKINHHSQRCLFLP